MARNRKKDSAVVAERPAPAAQTGKPADGPTEARVRKPLSRGKKLLFAFVCLVLFPVLAVTMAELTLRVAGYGFSPSFFIERKVNGEKVLTDNVRFGWRFFPFIISRRPHDFLIPAQKPADTYRVFVFGESAAWGDPDPSYGMSRILDKLLVDQFPGIKFEVVNSAMAAISSHVVYQIASDAARRQPDAFVVYMGNNEVIGPFGPGTVFSGFSDNINFIRAALWLKGQSLAQLFANMKVALEGFDKQPQVWAGMQMFEKNKVRSDDPRLETMYSHFRRNLTDIIRAGRRTGAGVVVCNMAANFGGWGPHASMHKAGLSADDLARWEKAFEAGKAAQAAEAWQEALGHFAQAEAVDATYAELLFRMGRCAARMKQFDKSKEYYSRAVDEDCLRFRTDSHLNEIMRETAATEKSAFVDVRGLFEQESPDGIPGMELLDDHVHLNFDGNYLIARALLPEVGKLIEESRNVKARDMGTPLSREECAARLAYTGYNQFRITERNLQRIKNPPFTRQPDHEEHMAWFTGLLDTLSTHSVLAGLKASADAYGQAVRLTPNDWVLHENLADLYQKAGQSHLESAALRRVLELMPHHEERYAWLGQSLLSQGKPDEAAQSYRMAVAYDPTNTNAYTGLGSALLKLGRVEEGIAQYEAATKARPGVAESHNALGEVYYRVDRLDQAEKAFAKATDLKPDYALAHTNLGVLQISRGRPDQAVPHLEKALEIRADFPDALKHMANIHVQSGREKEAISMYERAVTAAPQSGAVRKGYGLLLLQAGRKSEAAVQLREAQRLQPQDPELQKLLQDLGG